MMKKLQDGCLCSPASRRRFDSFGVYVHAVAASTLRGRLKKLKLQFCVVPRPLEMEEPTLGFTKGRL